MYPARHLDLGAEVNVNLIALVVVVIELEKKEEDMMASEMSFSSRLI